MAMLDAVAPKGTDLLMKAKAYLRENCGFTKRRDVEFVFVEEDDAMHIVSSMSKRTDNRRICDARFRKYYGNSGNRWIGMFEDGRCLSLAVLIKYPKNDLVNDIILLAEFQSFVKGCGKPLLEVILAHYPNIWWMVDPDGGNRLLSYYRQFKGMSESIFDSAGGNDNSQVVFYRVFGGPRRKLLLSLLQQKDSLRFQRKRP